MAGNKKIEIEYTIRSSPAILYNFLTTASGLAQWFADTVDIETGVCTFGWNGSEDTAHVVEESENEFIRYQWDYSDEDEYFEFRISKSEVTGDTILTITDFVHESEVDGQMRLWDSQVKMLTQQVGG